jgi:hypothetical protein
MSLKNSNDTIRNRTRDLPVCSVVPLLTRYREKCSRFKSSEIYAVSTGKQFPTFPMNTVLLFSRCSRRLLGPEEKPNTPLRNIAARKSKLPDNILAQQSKVVVVVVVIIIIKIPQQSVKHSVSAYRKSNVFHNVLPAVCATRNETLRTCDVYSRDVEVRGDYAKY